MDNKDLSYLAHIVVASISGMINVLITTPLWVATTRLTLQDRVNDSNSLDRRRHANPKKASAVYKIFPPANHTKMKSSKRGRKVIAILVGNQMMGLLQLPEAPAV